VTATTPPEQRKRAASSGSSRGRGYLVVAAVVVALAVGAVLVAVNSDPSSLTPPVDVKHLDVLGPAPALHAKGWINSPPLGSKELKGKVVLYDFWTYSCINCQRTFPYLRSWYQRYRADGLVIVGVHTPEFDFERSHKNVEAAAKRLDVTWPIALDDDETIWNAFENMYWPADYFADRRGRIRYSHFGEGDAAENTQAENIIRQLLGVPATASRAERVTNPETASKDLLNPETYLGTLRSSQQPQTSILPGTHNYPPAGTGSLRAPRTALLGRWTATAEYVESERTAATILVGVHALAANLVMATATGKPIEVVVELDGRPIPAADRGASVHEDGNGRTVVTVDKSDMYRILRTAVAKDHVLSVAAPGPGLQAYAFTFG
jgi:thiol-disulfide isomerase/thioredoxin